MVLEQSGINITLDWAEFFHMILSRDSVLRYYHDGLRTVLAQYLGDQNRPQTETSGDEMLELPWYAEEKGIQRLRRLEC